MTLMPEHSLTCTVYFRSADGRLAGHVTSGRTLFEVCRTALAWFADTSFWRGPVPTADTILIVRAVGREHVWRVRAGRVMAAKQSALFEVSGMQAFDPQ